LLEHPTDPSLAGLSADWTYVEPISSSRHYHSATRLNDGKVLVAGGYSGSTTLTRPGIYTP
jgi:hypothetical protein